MADSSRHGVSSLLLLFLSLISIYMYLNATENCQISCYTKQTIIVDYREL